MEKSLEEFKKDISNFFSKMSNGDKYETSDPKKEKGLQLDLYKYLLLDKKYDVVYELELPDLQQYLKESVDNKRDLFSYTEGSLRPDIVVKLGDAGYASIELKYNEPDDKQHNEDKKKNKVYVQHCSEIHYAARLHLHRKSIKLESLDDYPCKDSKYAYSNYQYSDVSIDDKGLKKVSNAYSIIELWEEKAKQIKDKKGEFSKYGY